MMKDCSIFLFILFFTLLNSLGFSEENISYLESAVTDDLHNLKDPFVSLLPHEEAKEEKIVAPIKQQLTPAQPEVSPPKFYIKGLLWGSDMPQAIIEDQVVKIGDKIKLGAKGRGSESGDEIEIINIDKYGVGILYKGRVFFINK